MLFMQPLPSVCNLPKKHQTVEATKKCRLKKKISLVVGAKWQRPFWDDTARVDCGWSTLTEEYDLRDSFCLCEHLTHSDWVLLSVRQHIRGPEAGTQSHKRFISRLYEIIQEYKLCIDFHLLLKACQKSFKCWGKAHLPAPPWTAVYWE